MAAPPSRSRSVSIGIPGIARPFLPQRLVTPRDQVIYAALDAFSRFGYGQTTVRGVAQAAGVDPRIVLRWYGDKQGLFLAAVKGAWDPTRIVAAVAEGGLDEVGPRLIAVSLVMWESPLGANLSTALRTSPVLASTVGGLLSDTIMMTASKTLGMSQHDVEVRAAMVEVQLIGVFVGRYMAKVEPLASLPREDIVRAMGPILQQTLTGENDNHRKRPRRH